MKSKSALNSDPSESDIRNALEQEERNKKRRDDRNEQNKAIRERRRKARVMAKRLLNPVPGFDQIRKASSKLKREW